MRKQQFMMELEDLNHLARGGGKRMPSATPNFPIINQWMSSTRSLIVSGVRLPVVYTIPLSQCLKITVHDSLTLGFCRQRYILMKLLEFK